MNGRVVTIWTCDRCSVRREVDGSTVGNTPPGWSQLALISRGEDPELLGMYCGSCLSTIKRAAEPVSQEGP